MYESITNNKHIKTLRFINSIFINNIYSLFYSSGVTEKVYRERKTKFGLFSTLRKNMSSFNLSELKDVLKDNTEKTGVSFAGKFLKLDSEKDGIIYFYFVENNLEVKILGVFIKS